MLDNATVNRLEFAIEYAELHALPIMFLGGNYKEVMAYADAFLGITNDDPPRAVYSEDKYINVLMNRDGMSFEEAQEFYEFNVLSIRSSDYPLFVDDFSHMQITD